MNLARIQRLPSAPRVALMDLAYPQRSTNRGQGDTEVYTTLEIGQYFHRRASALICSPKHVAVYGELDRDEGSLPTVQYGSPEDQFMGSSSCATTKQFGIVGNGTIVILPIRAFYTTYTF